MRIAGSWLAVILALGTAGNAQAYKCVDPPLLVMDSHWPAYFDRQFQSAEGVYLVRAMSSKARLMAFLGDMPCDYGKAGPPPPAPGEASAQFMAAYRADKRAAEQENQACSSSAVEFEVLETLKGKPRNRWVDTGGAFDIRSGPPTEPAHGPPTLAYAHFTIAGSAQFCPQVGLRRLSHGATYVVFMSNHGTQKHPALKVNHAFLADGTPFLKEARRLSARAGRPKIVP